MTQVSDFKKKAAVYGLLTLLTAALVFWLSAKCPYLSDDWHFFFVWDAFDPTEKTRRVQSFSDILTSMQNYYHLSGGRVIAHFLAYCLLTVSKTVFNLLNGVMYAAMCWLLYRIAEAAAGCKSIWLYPLTVLLSICVMPVFGDDVLWLSGSVNYLWMTIPLFGCINWLLRRYDKASMLERICILPLFLLSGATNEITGGMLAVALILRCILSERRNLFSLIGGLAAVVPGTCFVILAPGNAFRREVLTYASASVSGIILSCIGCLHYITQHTGILLLPVLLAFFLRGYDKSLTWKERLRPLELFLTGISGVFGLSLAGFWNSRPLYFTILLLMPAAISSCVSLYRLFRQQPDDAVQLYRRGICIFLLITGFLFFLHADLMIIGALCLPLALAVMKCKPERISAFAAGAGKLRRFVLPAACLMLCCILGISLRIFMQWNAEYAQYDRTVHELIQENALYEAAEMYCSPEKSCGLIPNESSRGKPWFRTEWMAEYYGADGQTIAEKYSDTYAPYLEHMQ